MAKIALSTISVLFLDAHLWGKGHEGAAFRSDPNLQTMASKQTSQRNILIQIWLILPSPSAHLDTRGTMHAFPVYALRISTCATA